MDGERGVIGVLMLDRFSKAICNFIFFEELCPIPQADMENSG
jgi:hypothetical protein